MLNEYALDIAAEIDYARRWAFGRNPAYYDFDGIGGDCTNFISQCLYAGGAAMNYTQDIGWYYNSLHDRSASWTSVEYLHSFIISNNGIGPFGKEVPIDKAKAGDIIQLGNEDKFYHSLLVIAVPGGEPYIACHTYDQYNIPLSSYRYKKARCIHVIGARK